MANESYYPLSFKEIVISGSWGYKIINEFLIKSAQINHTSYEKIKDDYIHSRKIPLNGVVIDVSPRTNQLSIDYNPLLNIDYMVENMKADIETSLNNYLSTLISKVKIELMALKILDFTWNKESRKSKFHIFNIEMLCSCAIKKPHLFNTLYELMRDRTALYENVEDYEFYIFALYDSENPEVREEIYDYMISRGEDIRNRHDPEYRKNKSYGPSFKNEIFGKLNDNEKVEIDKNLSKVRIVY